jgi:hypothetical protein
MDLIAVCVATFMLLLDITIVNVALPVALVGAGLLAMRGLEVRELSRYRCYEEREQRQRQEARTRSAGPPTRLS